MACIDFYFTSIPSIFQDLFFAPWRAPFVSPKGMFKEERYTDNAGAIIGNQKHLPSVLFFTTKIDSLPNGAMGFLPDAP